MSCISDLMVDVSILCFLLVEFPIWCLYWSMLVYHQHTHEVQSINQSILYQIITPSAFILPTIVTYKTKITIIGQMARYIDIKTLFLLRDNLTWLNPSDRIKMLVLNVK